MKKVIMLFNISILILIVLFACEEEGGVRKTMGDWNSKPIEEYVVTPINGGAKISYHLPNEEGLLYVMAEYERNGKPFTEKSSLHKNELIIEGFHNVKKVHATLYKINKDEQKSLPLHIEFEPKESLVSIAQHSLQVIPSFGGITAFWDNPQKTELGIRLLMKDSVETEKLLTKEMYFSTLEKEKHPFRGHAPQETTFAFLFEDKWGNTSDTLTFTLTPLFEKMIEKPYVDYRAYIPYDNTTSREGHDFNNIWDNIVNTPYHGYLTVPGSSGLSFTIDLKKVVKLSRVVIHSYHFNSPYDQASFTRFEVWGCANLDLNKLADLPYWLDEFSVTNGSIKNISPTTKLPDITFKNDWQYLGDHSIPRYSDPIEIEQLAENGAEYEFPIDATPVRFVRIFVREISGFFPPPSNNYFSCGEITFYGDDH